MISALCKQILYYNSCWFDSFVEVLFYFYAPIGCLFLLNTGLFVNCVWRLSHHHQRHGGHFKKLWRRHSKNRGIENGQVRLWLHLKLFAIMGLSWLFEVVSWALTTNWNGVGVTHRQQGDWDSPESPESCLPWYLWTADLINALQGVWMLIIYVCKRDVWLKLRRLRLTGGLTSNGNGTHT